MRSNRLYEILKLVESGELPTDSTIKLIDFTAVSENQSGTTSFNCTIKTENEEFTVKGSCWDYLTDEFKKLFSEAMKNRKRIIYAPTIENKLYYEV